MLKIKEGINVVGIQPEMILAAICAESFCTSINADCVITSALDSKHSINSKHYTGYALDFRTRDMVPIRQKMFHNAMKEALGEQYDVVLESDHLHVEFDPKYSSKFNG